jgi:high-affinity K+ transport system ATPase subunit B
MKSLAPHLALHPWRALVASLVATGVIPVALVASLIATVVGGVLVACGMGGMAYLVTRSL